LGAVHYSLDPRLARLLTDALEIEVLVETGTGAGQTVAGVRSLFSQIHTIESDRALYAAAAQRFVDDPGVHVHLGDSPRVLARVAPTLASRGALYWLDAHATGPATAPGPECPLIDELAAIARLNQHSVVLIDDARLFLAPPPPPRRAQEWPSLGDVLAQLARLSADHEATVFDDVIVYSPLLIRDRLCTFTRRHGVDWLAAADKARAYDALLGDARAKEELVQQQAAEAREKDTLIARLSAECRARDERLAALVARPLAEPWFVSHLTDVHSQCGEDGVLARLCELLGISRGWAVEVGAADGEWFSNSRNLIVGRGWSGVLVESDPRRFSQLEASYRDRVDVSCLQRLVTASGPDSLDQVLSSTPVPRDFELLSIDIDGNDAHVWAALANYRPRVVVVEFNPTIPNEVSFVQPNDSRLNQGASLRTLVEIGRTKGYELAAVTAWNAVFLVARDWQRLDLGDNSLERLRRDPSLLTYLFFGYDGTAFLAGSKRIPWHEIALRDADVQAIPRVLRRYPPRQAAWQRALYALWRRWRGRG